MILMDVMEDLEDEGIPFQRNVPIGMMVEVPSAVILAEEFAREVDFFSIGTNDLIQYTLACDRSDPTVAHLYRSGDPSILRLIQMVLRAAEKHGKSVTVCGQMSSDPRFIPLLLGMGLRSLSATPQAIPRLKEVVRNLSISEACGFRSMPVRWIWLGTLNIICRGNFHDFVRIWWTLLVFNF
jgi:phosphotransferase system enzyme I (PtsI)